MAKRVKKKVLDVAIELLKVWLCGRAYYVSQDQWDNVISQKGMTDIDALKKILRWNLLNQEKIK